METAIWVKTQEQYNKLMERLEDEGLTWVSGDKPTSKNYFGRYEKLCIRVYAPVREISFNSMEFSKGGGDKIISFEEYMGKQFKKGDLLVDGDKLYTVYIGEVEGITVTSDTSYSVDGAMGYYSRESYQTWSKDEWKERGWKKHEDKLELTLDEIAEKFGVSVDKLKIKK